MDIILSSHFRGGESTSHCFSAKLYISVSVSHGIACMYPFCEPIKDYLQSI